MNKKFYVIDNGLMLGSVLYIMYTVLYVIIRGDLKMTGSEKVTMMLLSYIQAIFVSRLISNIIKSIN